MSAAWLRLLWRGITLSWSRTATVLWVVAAVNLISHPLAWHAVASGTASWLGAELLVVAAEAAMLYLVLRQPPLRTCLVAIGINVASLTLALW